MKKFILVLTLLCFYSISAQNKNQNTVDIIEFLSKNQILTDIEDLSFENIQSVPIDQKKILIYKRDNVIDKEIFVLYEDKRYRVFYILYPLLANHKMSTSNGNGDSNYEITLNAKYVVNIEGRGLVSVDSRQTKFED